MLNAPIGNQLQVAAQSTPNMSVQVYAGMILVPGTLGSTTGWYVNNTAQTGYGLPSDFTSQGAYCFYNDGTVTLDIATADPSNPRIDIVCASVEDAQYQGSNNEPVLQVITGTPGASPSAPSAPATSVVLAQISVPAGATSITNADITDERPTPVSVSQPPYGYAYYGTSGTPFGSGAWEQIPLAGNFVGNGMTAGSNSLIVPIPGIYQCSWQAGLASPTAGGQLISSIYQNGSSAAWGQQVEIAGAATYFVSSSGSAILKCNAGDILTLWMRQTTGASQNASSGPGNIFLTAAYLGPS